MKLKKLGLSVLLFSTALVTAGVTTQANASASSSDTSTMPTTKTDSTTDTPQDSSQVPEVSAVFPQSDPSIVQLLSNITYTFYTDEGTPLTDTIQGPSAYIADAIALNLTPEHAGSFLLRTGNSKWVKLDSDARLNIGGSENSAGIEDTLTDEGGLTPTNFVVNFTDQDGKSIQKSIVLPISSETDQRVSYMNDNIATVMKSLHNDLTHVTYNIDDYTPRATDPVTSDGDYTTTFHYLPLR